MKNRVDIEVCARNMIRFVRQVSGSRADECPSRACMFKVGLAPPVALVAPRVGMRCLQAGYIYARRPFFGPSCILATFPPGFEEVFKSQPAKPPLSVDDFLFSDCELVFSPTLCNKEGLIGPPSIELWWLCKTRHRPPRLPFRPLVCSVLAEPPCDTFRCPR